MNFLLTMRKVCTDPGAFRELAEQPLYRPLLHLLLLTMMLAALVFFGQYYAVNRLHPEKIAAAVVAEFGGIRNSPHGLKPLRNPDQARNMALTRDFQLSYFPGKDVRPEALKIADYVRGIVWTPGLVLMWQKRNANDITLMPLLGSGDPGKRVLLGDLFVSGPKEISSFIRKYYASTVTFPFSLETVLQGWVPAFLVLITITELLRVLGSVLIFNTLFTGCYSFAGGGRATGLNFRRIFVIGLYSGFPALMVATFFTAFDLPLLDFNTVYLFGFLGYFLIIMSRIQREFLIARMGGRENHDDDDL